MKVKAKRRSEEECFIKRDPLSNLLLFVHFKKREKTYGGVLLLVKLQAEGLMGVFQIMQRVANCTKHRK